MRNWAPTPPPVPQPPLHRSMVQASPDTAAMASFAAALLALVVAVVTPGTSVSFLVLDIGIVAAVVGIVLGSFSLHETRQAYGLSLAALIIAGISLLRLLLF
jgi:hypothetical protein